MTRVSKYEWPFKEKEEAEQEAIDALVDSGVPECIFKAARFYEEGVIVDRSNEKAFELYEKAAQMGNPEAQVRLAELYFEGKGVEKSYKIAFELYEKAAENGSRKAHLELSRMYDRGLGVNRSEEKAMEECSLAMGEGETCDSYDMGILHSCEYKNECPQRSFEWFSRAAEEGEPLAYLQLGLMYMEGKGVKASGKDALKWFQKAADEGNALALTKMGNIYC